MAKFNDLSIDLIYVIFSHLQSDRLQLHWLALSSRLFRDVAQRFIVRNASISHSIRGSRTQLFLRTLTERPDLVAHVHRLELNLLREDIHWPEEQQTICQLTRLLTNLREFCYLSGDYKIWHYSIPQPLKWGREHAHDQIRRVEWHHNMSPWELRKLLELPRIESVYVRELAESTSLNVPESSYKTSTLVELRIGAPDKKASESLGILLKIPAILKKITFESRVRYNPIIEPTGLVQLLDPVRDTLEELRVDIRNNMLGEHPQPADLSGFVSLKKLALPFRFIFGRLESLLDYTNVHLPHSLNELELAFVAEEALRNAWFPESEVEMPALQEFGRWLMASDGQHNISIRLPLLTWVTFKENNEMSPYSDVWASSLRHTVRRWMSRNFALFIRTPQLQFTFQNR